MSNPGMTVTIHAENREDMHAKLFELAQAFGGRFGTVAQTDDYAAPGEPLEAQVDVAPEPAEEPKKRKRSSGKKKAADKPEDKDGSPDESPDESPAEEPAADASVMEDLKPAEARKRGIAEIQAHFAENPSSITKIGELQDKFEVRMFKDIKDEDAHQFLADVRLITAGAPE